MENQTIRDFIAPTDNHMDGSVGGFGFIVVYDGSTADVPNNTPLTTYYEDKYLGLTRGFDVVTDDGGRTYKPADSSIAMTDTTEVGSHYALQDNGEPKMWIYFHDDAFAFQGDTIPCYTIGTAGELISVEGVQFAARFDDFGNLQGWDLC